MIEQTLLDPLRDKPLAIKLYCEGGVFELDEKVDLILNMPLLTSLQDLKARLNHCQPFLSFGMTSLISLIIAIIGYFVV